MKHLQVHDNGSETSAAFRVVCAAARALAGDERWCDMLAENLYWASMEAFLQSSLLAAINRTDEGFIADRERNVSPRLRPDLLVFPVRAHDAWWQLRERAQEDTSLSDVLRLAVQMKVAWTRGNATGSATLPNKIAATRSDIALLHEVLPGKGAVAVLVSGFHPRGDGAREVEAALRALVAEVPATAESLVLPLLEDYRPARWDKLLEPDRAAFSMLWLARIQD